MVLVLYRTGRKVVCALLRVSVRVLKWTRSFSCRLRKWRCVLASTYSSGSCIFSVTIALKIFITLTAMLGP